MADGRVPAGRDDELAWLIKQRDAVAHAGAGVLVLTGEAGIGKTTLVESLLDRSDGWAVRSTACPPSGLDVEPVLGALLGSSAGGAGPERFAPAAPGRSVSLEEVAALRRRWLSALTHQLLDTAGPHPTLVVIDDLHWAPRPVLDFVRLVVEEVERRRRQLRTLVVLVSRALPPSHPFAALVDDIARRPWAERLDLGPLSDDAIDDVVSAAEGEVSNAYLDVVRRAARGNPLRTGAALRVLRKRQVPREVSATDERTWATLRLAAALDDPIAAWVAGFDTADRDILGAASVGGSEVTAADLAQVTVSPPAPCLQRAISEGLLETDGHSYWFAHALFREAVYDALPVADRQAIHLAWGRVVSGWRHPNALAAGTHYLAASDLAPPAEAARALWAAGEAALAVTSWTDATRLLAAAREAAQRSDATSAPERASLTVALGKALYFDHGGAAAEAILREAVALADAAGAIDAWGEALVTLLRLVTASSPDAWRHPTDLALTERFLDRSEDPGWNSQVLQVQSEAQTMAGQLDLSAVTADACTDLARRSGQPATMALAVYARAFADMTALRIWDGLAGTEEALRIARDGGDWFVQDIMRTRLLFPLLATGEVSRADGAAVVAVAASAANHEHSNQALGKAVRASAAFLRGDIEAAAALAREASDHTRRSGYVLADLFSAPVAVLGEVARGRLAEAQDLVASWPNLSHSARRALATLVDAFEGIEPTEPARVPTTLTQVSAGFFVAELDAALLTGGPLPDRTAGELLDRWIADGLEVPPSYPTSVTRVRAALLAAEGDLDGAAEGYQAAAARWAERSGELELARILAGWATVERRRGRPELAGELSGRATITVDRAGVGRLLLGPAELVTAGPGDGSAAADHGGEPGWRVILITDVVGSTRISQELGDVAYLELVLAHHGLVRRQLHRFGGVEFSESGDGLLAWFGTAAHAVQAALAIQEDLAAPTGPASGLQVRIGLAAGVPLFHNTRPYGLVLNRAARIVAEAGPGEVLVDEAVAAHLPAAAVAVDLREINLRGIGNHLLATVQPAG